jgi:signal transduction histidine kinase
MFGTKTLNSFKYLRDPKQLKQVFRRFSLRTQLLLILLFILAISVSSLSVIYSQAEEMFIDRVTDSLDDITKAIQISVEQMTYEDEGNTERLKSTVDMLNKKGIKEISIIGDDSQIIASSNPSKVGTVENPKKLAGKGVKKKGFFITAKIGEEKGKENQRPYDVIMPVSVKGQNLGYIHISMILDDFHYLQRKNHLKRILTTLFAFGLGIIVSIFLADQYTDPIKRIANASKEIARGKLVKIRQTKRRDEIGILVSSFNDMVDKLSERQVLEEKLKKTEQLSMIGHLASGIAHEVRNPLNFLSLSIGHIKDRLSEERIEKGDDILKLLDSLKKEIFRVNELINNFLFLGKPIVLHKDWVSAGALMDDALYMVKDKLREGIEIGTESQEMNTLIFCDRDCIRLCLINLLVNSIQAIEGQGSIAVHFWNCDDMSCISVADTGIGVTTEDLDKMLEPYFSTKKLGIGLGLTITRRFVEEHAGTISAESVIGQHTTVTIKVPLHGIR